jgi:hypothetical protein
LVAHYAISTVDALSMQASAARCFSVLDKDMVACTTPSQPGK